MSGIRTSEQSDGSQMMFGYKESRTSPDFQILVSIASSYHNISSLLIPALFLLAPPLPS